MTSEATFAFYSWLYGQLTPAVAFTATSLFNVLRFPLTMFPNTITSAVEATVSLRRLEKFLLSEEIKGRSRVGSRSMYGDDLIYIYRGRLYYIIS